MSHLTAAQFVDALEHRTALPRRVTEHLADCRACRDELAALVDAHGEVQAVSVPEPSPLFWDHFSRRVRAATSLEAMPRITAVERLWSWWRPLTSVAVVAAALAIVVLFRPDSWVGRRLIPASPTGMARVTVSPNAAEVGVDDGSLDVAAVLAADLKSDDLQQLTRPTADATGAALEDLTPAQCEEMMRLIKTQMGGAERP